MKAIKRLDAGSTGQAQAKQDWGTERSRYFVAGTLNREGHGLLPGQIFYLASTGSTSREMDRTFCEEYNAALAGLVKMHGVPSWAPGSRVPARSDCRHMLNECPSIKSEALPPAVVRNMKRLERNREREGAVVQVRLLDTKRQVILIGYSGVHKAVAIDVLDILFNEHMISYDFQKIEFSHLPWD